MHLVYHDGVSVAYISPCIVTLGNYYKVKLHIQDERVMNYRHELIIS